MAFTFQFLNSELAAPFTSIRNGEIKLGQDIHYFNDIDSLLARSEIRYVIFGAEDDIGVLQNNGLGGASTSWPLFLKSFLNIQSNDFIPNDHISVLGSWKYTEDDMDIQQSIIDLDYQISNIVQQIVLSGKIPILVGGGHNNSYGMISGVSRAMNAKINVINLDPHSDLRTTELRHSGNGFSYAIKDGFLEKYFVVGLHESYNNAYMLDLIHKNDNISFISMEDIFIRNSLSWDDEIFKSIEFVLNNIYGVELDMDAIEGVLSSAMTPFGISALQAARFAYLAAQNASYFHLAEGVAYRSDGMEQLNIGKLQSYIVTSFIKGHFESKK